MNIHINKQMISALTGIMLISFASIATATPIYQGIILSASKDTYVRADYSARTDDNYGREYYFGVGSGREPIGVADKQRTLISFDINHLVTIFNQLPIASPDDITNRVDSADMILTIHHYEPLSPPHTDTNFNISIYENLQNWEEGNGIETRGPGSPPLVEGPGIHGVVWEATDPKNSTKPDTGDLVSTGFVAKDLFLPSMEIEIDLTDTVVSWLKHELFPGQGSNPEYGIQLVDHGTDGTFRGVYFRSSEYYTGPPAARGGLGRPELHIKYDAPEPSSFLIFLSAMLYFPMKKLRNRFMQK